MEMQREVDQDIFENLIFLFDRRDGNSYHIAENLKKFMDEMPGGFFIYRAGGKEELIYANAAMLRLFNCATMEEFRELTGNSFRGIVHPDDLEEVEQSIAEQIARSQYALDYVEYRIIRKDGEIRWLEDYGHFVQSDMGDIFYVFVGDATDKNARSLREREVLMLEKQQREQHLQKQIDEYSQQLKVVHQEQLRRLEMIEGLSIDYESIFYVDLDRNWMKAYRISSRFEKKFPRNGFMCEFSGFDTDYINKWVLPEDRELLYGVSDPVYIREKLSENRSFHINYRINRDGNTGYMQLHVVNTGNERQISQVVIGYRNIDDEIIQEMEQKRKLEEALNEANMANNAKNRFLSNMSHDIRTPMNAIVGFTSLIKRHIHDKDRIFGYLNMISESSDQLLQLLGDVLEISRLESGKVHAEEVECSLMDIAHQVQMELLMRASAKNITLSLDISNLKHDTVLADRLKLIQILTYLVDNAVRYTPKDGCVTISVMEKEQEESKDNREVYQIAVEDNGIGIGEEFLAHVFEPFEREKNTTMSGMPGTGLGLTIAKRLMEIMGGTIEAASVKGKGSKFTLTLVLSRCDSQSDAADEMEIPTGFSSFRRILVVDDNEINREIENEVLKDAGFLVDMAEDGSIAVEKIRHSKPGEYDLILMDIQMPVMDGYHATMAIRKIDNPVLSGIPIIAVSANTFEEDKKMAMESGMNDHLPKPLDAPRLYKTIRKFLKEDKRAGSAENTGICPDTED